MWDVLFYDDEQQRAYRIQAKRLTVGDGVALDSLADEIAGREALNGRALLSLANNYPLMRYGVAAVEVVTLDHAPDLDEKGDMALPDDLPWQAFELTEAGYWELDETLLAAWINAVVARNPHRDPMLDMLKKNVLLAARARANDDMSNDNKSDDAA